MNLLVAAITMVITGGAIWYGVYLLTGNGNAGLAFGVAVGWLAYQVTLSLQKIEDKK